MATVELRFTALPAHVRTARLVAATLARRNGMDAAVVDEVKLAVGEACARAVGLHQAHAAGEDVVVTFTDDGERYVIEVRDRGPRGADTAIESTGSELAELPDLVDVDELVDPNAGDLAESARRLLPPGFGLAVVAGLADEVSVEHVGGGTVVRMAWPIKAGGDAG